jgi:hypothetical protein
MWTIFKIYGKSFNIAWDNDKYLVVLTTLLHDVDTMPNGAISCASYYISLVTADASSPMKQHLGALVAWIVHSACCELVVVLRVTPFARPYWAATRPGSPKGRDVQESR